MSFIINILLGFFIGQLIDISTRNKQSETSPVKFNIVFFLKDNWLKITVSLLLSISIGVFIYYNEIDISSMIEGIGFNVHSGIIFFLIGFCPEIILQIAKHKYGFLQPKEVDGFQRK